MNCKFCNEPISESDKFCSKCGTEITTPPVNKTKSKLTCFNIVSIAISAVMLILQFLPWIVIIGEAHSVLYWLANISFIRSELPYFVVLYLLIWIYSCFTIPAIVIIIVKKNSASPIFSILVSAFAILSVIVTYSYPFIATGPYLTPIPSVLLLCAIANIIITKISRKK